jgi:hypothetical protein
MIFYISFTPIHYHIRILKCAFDVVLSSRIPRSSASALTFLSLIKSSHAVNFLVLLYVQCLAIVRLEIWPFSMLLPTVSYEHSSLLASDRVVHVYVSNITIFKSRRSFFLNREKIRHFPFRVRFILFLSLKQFVLYRLTLSKGIIFGEVADVR